MLEPSFFEHLRECYTTTPPIDSWQSFLDFAQRRAFGGWVTGDSSLRADATEELTRFRRHYDINRPHMFIYFGIRLAQTEKRPWTNLQEAIPHALIQGAILAGAYDYMVRRNDIARRIQARDWQAEQLLTPFRNSLEEMVDNARQAGAPIPSAARAEESLREIFFNPPKDHYSFLPTLLDMKRPLSHPVRTIGPDGRPIPMQ